MTRVSLASYRLEIYLFSSRTILFFRRIISIIRTYFQRDWEMKIEKKLIAYAAIPLLVGILSTSPLLFLMSAKAETSKPWFSISMPYVYCEAREGAYNYSNIMGPTINISSRPVFSHRFGYVLDLTQNAELDPERNLTRLEFLQINLTTNEGPLETNSFAVGTSNTVSYPPSGFQFSYLWFDTKNFSGGGIFSANWTAGISRLEDEGTSGIGTSNRYLVALEEAQTVYVTLYRIGWVTFEGDSTVVTFANYEVLSQVQLERYGSNGWLYNNNFIPPERLSQINPGKPLVWDPKTAKNVPNL